MKSSFTPPVSRISAAQMFFRPLAVVTLLLTFALLPFARPAQNAQRPLTEAVIIDLLHNAVSSSRLQDLVRQRGVSFQMTHDTERDLKAAGADESLLKVIAEVAPNSAAHAPDAGPANPLSASAVLEILSTPGSASVYVDDEPMGTTSPDGRLKLTRLAAGEHKVRIAHAGFRDIEQTTQLVPGKSSTLFASLVPVQAQNPLAPESAPPASSNPEGSSPPGALGMFVTQIQGAATGMAIQAVVPGSPADRSGFRPGDTVLSIAGQPVAAPQDVSNALSAHHTGDTVEVTIKQGEIVRTKQVRLAGPEIMAGVARFRVNHDHGISMPGYCTGWMTVVGGRILFVGETGTSSTGTQAPVHAYTLFLNDVKDVKKNPMYLAIFGAFHIRMKDGTNLNFVVIDSRGMAQPPEALLRALREAGAGR